MKTRTLALLASVTVLALIVAAPATEAMKQTDPKSQLNKVLEERISQKVEEIAKEQKMYNELFGDCNKYLARAVSAAESVTKVSLGTQSVSLSGLLNIELYKICRELKSGR